MAFWAVTVDTSMSLYRSRALQQVVRSVRHEHVTFEHQVGVGFELFLLFSITKTRCGTNFVQLLREIYSKTEVRRFSIPALEWELRHTGPALL